MKLVFIHGRAQAGKDPIMLRTQWEDALKQGLQAAQLAWPQGLTIEFPFYGDALDGLIKNLNTPLMTEVMTRGAPIDSGELAFRGELLYEMATQSGISDAEIQAYYAGEPKERGPLNWEWVQSILKALDKTPLGEPAIDIFTRDVYVYLTYRVVRKAIDEIVAEQLKTGPCIVVGHSLGSVVGYNVLSKLPATMDVRLYVTLGSPLGIEVIKRRLDKPLAMPSCVKQWYNAMDERDVVALYPLTAEHFSIEPRIENKINVDNFTDNRHGIAGYLSDPDVARKIHEALI